MAPPVELEVRKAVADLDALKSDGRSSAALPYRCVLFPGSLKDLDFAVAVADDSEAEDVVHRLRERGYQPVEIFEQDYVERLSAVG